MAFRPLTRKEKFLSAIAGEGTETPKPLTRKERFYNALLGKGEAPEPMTREEVLFKKIVENGGGGGGSVSAPLIVHSLVEDNGDFGAGNFKSITVMAESVGRQAFGLYESLENATLVGVVNIGETAFVARRELKSITIPDSLVTIGNRAFEGCEALKSVYITDLEAWCNISFYDYDSNPCYYGADIYLNGEKLTELVIPDTVIAIKNYAFRGCTSLTSVTIPEGVTSIGKYAFSGCTSLTSITIPEGVTSIGDYAFSSCTSLTSITIPKSVTNLGLAAFYECSLLTEITYEGTVAEWTALDTQGIVWGVVTVHCTDGDTTASVADGM